MDSSSIFLPSNSDLESLTRISLSTVSLLITLLFLSANNDEGNVGVEMFAAEWYLCVVGVVMV